MLSKDLWLVFCMLAAATTLCAMAIISADAWISVIQWVLVPYAALKAVSLIPWRRPPDIVHYHPPTEPLYRGIFSPGLQGSLTPLTEHEVEFLDSLEPGPPIEPKFEIERRGLWSRLFRRRSLTPSILIGAVALVMLGDAFHYAYAGTGDPVTGATDATSDLWDIVQTHGLSGVGLIAYGVLSKFLDANKTQHWLKEGRVLAILTGVSMVAGAVALWQFSGGELEAVLSAIIAAIALILKPTQNGTPAPVTAPA